MPAEAAGFEGATPGPFVVLTVCTGNVCRSPLAERMLATGFADLARRAGPAWRPARGVRFRSAGTRALVGQPMTPQTEAIARAHGAEPVGHLARQLDPADVADAGLVLALTRAHRREVVSLVPRASRTTFALPEFARLLSDVAAGEPLDLPDRSEPTTALPAILDAVARRRGLVPPPDDPASDDVIDPFGRADAVYERTAGQIGDATNSILAALERILGER